MGGMLGGGDSGGGLGGLLDPLGLFNKGEEGGGGFLGNLLGGLPDPLGVGDALGITGGAKAAGEAAGQPGPYAPPPPAGVQYNGGPQGVGFNPNQMLNSPMGPTGFGVGGGPPKK